MRRFPGLFAVTAVCTVVAITSCGASGAPTRTGTNSPQATQAQVPTLSSTPPPSTTAAPTASELLRVAGLVYPPCTPSTCAGSSTFTTCDAASAEETDVFADCPLTPTLEIQLRDDVGASPSAPDPLGGGQDPEWTAERFSAAPSATGGVVEATLGVGTASERLRPGHDRAGQSTARQRPLLHSVGAGRRRRDGTRVARACRMPLLSHHASRNNSIHQARFRAHTARREHGLMRNRREGEIRTPDLAVPNRAL